MGRIPAQEKYKIIHKMASKRNSRLNIKYMCDFALVSRSGYYNFLKYSKKESKKEQNDSKDFKLILDAYNFKRRHKGARLIKMTLEKQYGLIMNLKKIRRLMAKFGLVCPIRKANPYRRMAKALQTNNVFKNTLDRKFKEGNPGEKFLTDITYLFYGKTKDKAYLSTIKDSITNEIVAYKLSKSLDISFVLDTVDMLINNSNIKITKDAFIHSDQGCHYTSIAFQKLLKEYGIGQSMSRRGNCWDNAPQESFFGHMKDEIYLRDCSCYEELQNEIDDYIDYYNNHRYQWNLNRMSPSEYRNYLIHNISA
jgi:transposase InsO family protein